MKGNPIPIPKLSESDLRRFWLKVDKSPGLGPDGDCWEWAECRDGEYGRFYIHRKGYLAHRVMRFIANGHRPIINNLRVLHHCDNRKCVKPSHLWLGTDADNNRDRDEKGRGGASVGDFNGARLHPERLPQGEANSNSRLSEVQVREIRNRYADGGISQKKLGKEYGVSTVTIGLILRRKAWRHI